MASSSIEWTGKTWNPITGCSKISQGCKFCYAEVMARRLQAMGQPRYANGFRVTLQEDALSLPLQWHSPERVFVNSMSDLYHEQVPLEYIQRIFSMMQEAHWHQFQILTKRAERLAEISSELSWESNIQQGVSVERDDYLWRVDLLRQTGAAIKFLSLEPLLGSLPHLDLSGIQWVIIGGESGHKARPIQVEWVYEIIKQCREQGVMVFVKQMGSAWAKEHGYRDKGGDWSVWEKGLCIREYPYLPFAHNRHGETLYRIAPRQCDTGRAYRDEWCKNSASWCYRGEAVCIECMQTMSDMSSGNADVFASALL